MPENFRKILTPNLPIKAEGCVTWRWKEEVDKKSRVASVWHQLFYWERPGYVHRTASSFNSDEFARSPCKIASTEVEDFKEYWDRWIFCSQYSKGSESLFIFWQTIASSSESMIWWVQLFFFVGGVGILKFFCWQWGRHGQNHHIFRGTRSIWTAWKRFPHFAGESGGCKGKESSIWSVPGGAILAIGIFEVWHVFLKDSSVRRSSSDEITFT